MAEQKAGFIKVETPPGTQQTLPVKPERRLADDEINISLCDIEDADKIVGCRALALYYYT